MCHFLFISSRFIAIHVGSSGTNEFIDYQFATKPNKNKQKNKYTSRHYFNRKTSIFLQKPKKKQKKHSFDKYISRQFVRQKTHHIQTHRQTHKWNCLEQQTKWYRAHTYELYIKWLKYMRMVVDLANKKTNKQKIKPY